MVYPKLLNMELVLLPRQTGYSAQQSQILGLPVEEIDANSSASDGEQDEHDDTDHDADFLLKTGPKNLKSNKN